MHTLCIRNNVLDIPGDMLILLIIGRLCETQIQLDLHLFLFHLLVGINIDFVIVNCIFIAKSGTLPDAASETRFP